MKKLIKKAIPDMLKPLVYSDFMINIFRRNYRKKLKDKSTAEVFTFIYKSNVWSDKESASGSGSNSLQTQGAILVIEEVVQKLGVKNFLDIPCGDLQWMQSVKLNGASYTGGDIVKEIIQSNNSKYGSDKVKFLEIDLINDELPKADILLCRDCFVHLSTDKVLAALDNIRKHDIKYLLTTSFPDTKVNKNILTGEWRSLNLELPPFNLKPVAVYNEGCTEKEDRSYADKSLILLKLK